ncbi:MAG: hypothetical protein IKW89_12940 [Bacteroidales bacterium]|nr:hypothetical protein [Bacteroidales bacterium]
MSMFKKYFCLLTAVLISAVGCNKEGEENGYERRPGLPIQFSAESEASMLTRTSYSGIKDADNMERINWLSGDKIRIYSAEAMGDAAPYADYEVTDFESKTDKFHRASISPVNGSMKWGDRETHTFYSVYPVPNGTDTKMEANVVTSVLPPDQSFATSKTNDVTPTPGVYYGNMDLCYMTAATKGDHNGGDTDPVWLSFTPIVTTFYVTITNNYSGGHDMNLQQIILSSAQDAMTGTYRTTMTNVDYNTSPRDGHNYTRTYTYAESGWGSLVTRTEANSRITFNWTGDVIPYGESVTVALFALPQTIHQVTLTVVTAEGSSSIDLKSTNSAEQTDSDGWIIFDGLKKHNVSNLGVPEWEYDIDICDVDNTPATLNYSHTAGTSEPRTFSVRSRKTNDNGAHWYPTPWKAQYWSDTDNDQVQDADEWFDIDPSDYPAWLLSIDPVADSPTTAAYEGNHVAKMTAQTVQTHEERLKTAWTAEIEAAKQNVNGKYDKARVNLQWWNHLTHANGAATTTANCYIVQGPGDYIFPMVYGNGIDMEFKHVETNEGAYDPPREYFDYLDQFHNHCRNTFDYLGMATSDRIKDPWISRHGTHTALGITTDYYGHHCTEVGVLWQDFKNGQNVITDVGYLETITYADNKSDRYVTFSVGENISPGNALIYVKDVHLNVIAWTWHIWITDQNLSPVAMKNSSQNTFHVQPVNLGWVDDSDGLYYPSRQGIVRFVCVEHESTVSPTLTLNQTDYEDESISGWAPYFQWGRKDPIRAGSPLVDDEPHHLYYSIQHPDKFLSDHDPAQDEFDWSDNDYLNLWRYDYYRLDGLSPDPPLKNTAVQKSVYDPCPRGYKVPAGNTWTGLTFEESTLVSGKGRYFPTASGGQLFFPAEGYINGYGVVTDAGSAGMYWLDVPHGDTARNSYCLNYGASGISAPGYVNRAYGLSVRCEREDANTSM